MLLEWWGGFATSNEGMDAVSEKMFTGGKFSRVQLRASLISVLAMVLSGAVLAQGEKRPEYPSFSYEVAETHEIKPHRRTIPIKGVEHGLNQLRLTLTVSLAGGVVRAEANGDDELMKLWPQLESEVLSWKFTPFEKDGKAVPAEIEEYIDLVPPERLPTHYVIPPMLGPESKITITLQRWGCLGSCPSYKVTVNTDGMVFDGGGNVVSSGKHTDTANVDELRILAKKFIAADFYSMDDSYRASVTDCPTYQVGIEIDGHKKEVEDYMGSWVGMPAIVTELEEEVDTFARTERWIKGGDGLVAQLKAEKFNFRTFDAQVMLKEAATRGRASTVKELLKAGVPLKPIPAPKPVEPYEAIPFEHVGWLTAASKHPDVLQTLIDADASKNDQSDKKLALAGAAKVGNIVGARALIKYGANPSADLRKLTVTESDGGMSSGGPGAGSVLIYAAQSGNPEIVREILRYHPNLEARDSDGQTAIFALGEWRSEDEDGARVECLRLLVREGANVNARDNDGNTPLHEIYLDDIEEELLKLGADVNARNKDGETPIFTNVDESAISLFIEHGADLTIRNNKGQTVMEAAKEKGPAREKALREALEKMKKEKQ
jgi:ankyrin repeat protein